MAKILFGPAGLGGVGEAVENLELFQTLGLKACEISFTYGVYIKEKDVAAIRAAAAKFGVKLSIHAQYWINLNSEDKDKIEKSKKRILACCEIGEKLGVETVVFHPGFYGKDSKEVAYEQIKNQILEIEAEIKKNNWKIKIAPETTGKINVFGSVDEILQLVEDTGCSFTIDFAHLYARNQGKIDYNEVLEKFDKFKKLHCHFSGIEFTAKGEKRHKLCDEKELEKLLKVLVKSGKEVVLINESPSPVDDSILGLDVLSRLQ